MACPLPAAASDRLEHPSSSGSSGSCRQLRLPRRSVIASGEIGQRRPARDEHHHRSAGRQQLDGQGVQRGGAAGARWPCYQGVGSLPEASRPHDLVVVAAEPDDPTWPPCLVPPPVPAPRHAVSLPCLTCTVDSATRVGKASTRNGARVLAGDVATEGGTRCRTGACDRLQGRRLGGASSTTIEEGELHLDRVTHAQGPSRRLMDGNRRAVDPRHEQIRGVGQPQDQLLRHGRPHPGHAGRRGRRPRPRGSRSPVPRAAPGAWRRAVRPWSRASHPDTSASQPSTRTTR